MFKMKILFLVTCSLFAVSRAKEYCRVSQDTLSCDWLNLESHIPIQLSEIVIHNSDTNKNESLDKSLPNFKIYNSKGSIGEKTFSLMPEVEYLKLASCKIHGIEDDALCSLPKLKKIELYSNDLFPTLTESMLKNCQNIKELITRSVEMEPNALANMVGLETLRIESQRISRLSKDYLQPLTLLKSLAIVDCTIGQIDADALCLSPKLEDLVLGGDEPLPPVTDSTFKNCKNLKSVQINFNNNENIVPGTFNGFENAKEAAINGSSIPHLKKEHLLGLSNVETLVISHSGVRQIDNDVFGNFGNLKQLSLRGNELTEFSSDVIAPLEKLTFLDITKNKLTTIDELHHPNLELIYTFDNNLDYHNYNDTAIKINFPRLQGII